jgi:hypothetical protein
MCIYAARRVMALDTRLVKMMVLIHEPEQALHGAQRSDFLLRFGSRHYRCTLQDRPPSNTTI